MSDRDPKKEADRMVKLHGFDLSVDIARLRGSNLNTPKADRIFYLQLEQVLIEMHRDKIRKQVEDAIARLEQASQDPLRKAADAMDKALALVNEGEIR